MTALAAARNTPKYAPGESILTVIDVPLKASAKVYQGSIVCRDSTGYGVKGATAVGLIACGMLSSEQSASPFLENTGSNGDVKARVVQGVFRFANLGSDVLAEVDVGQVCFIVDDQTVAKTDGGGTRSPAGVVMAVDTSGAWVSIAQQLSKMIESSISNGAAPLESGLLSGALSVVKRSSTLAVSGTVAYSLADGTRVGQRKTITADSAGATPHGVLTPAHGSGWTSADFTTARGSLELEWVVGGWRIVFVGGTVAIT
jgi:hypothetical protein